jgi:succinoglycan biosynthesis protein ExoV
MQLYHYRDRAPNFGDELNAWLFPRLLPPGCFTRPGNTLFLGIGSILFDTHPQTLRKLVFGSGYGGYTQAPKLDDTWDIRFVRGRMTASALGLTPDHAVGDSAILLAGLDLKRAPRPGHRLYMPHLDSACDGAWAGVAKAAGLHYVDPRAPVDDILAEILSAELVVSEAMHGAIVADALRVPWVGVRPQQAVHHAKWQDWGSALGLLPRLHPVPASNALEALLRASAGRRGLQRRLRWRMRHRQTLGSTVFRGAAAEALGRAASAEPQLSADEPLAASLARMQAEVARLSRELENPASG